MYTFVSGTEDILRARHSKVAPLAVETKQHYGKQNSH